MAKCQIMKFVSWYSLITRFANFAKKVVMVVNVITFTVIHVLHLTAILYKTPENSEYYQNKLLEMMLVEMRILMGGGHFIFQQDGERAHTAKDTVVYLEDNVPEFIEPEKQNNSIYS